MDDVIDDVIDEIISDLAAGLIDASDSEIEAKLDEYGLDPSDRAAILEAIAQVRDAESMADDNLDPLNIDAVDAMADADATAYSTENPFDDNAMAQDMADEDDSNVTVTEADTDGDGDNDYVSMKKDTPEYDDSDEGNADESDDKPHDEQEVVSDKKEKNIKKNSSTVCSDERMKNIISTLSNFRY